LNSGPGNEHNCTSRRWQNSRSLWQDFLSVMRIARLRLFGSLENALQIHHMCTGFSITCSVFLILPFAQHSPPPIQPFHLPLQCTMPLFAITSTNLPYLPTLFSLKLFPYLIMKKIVQTCAIPTNAAVMKQFWSPISVTQGVIP
jgi:hypothetical protein